jgi:protein-S-isoprenylcysteine O-methyltransferase Ste14
VNPLALHDAVADDLLRGVLVAWVAFELVIQLRNRRRRNVGDWTLPVVILCVGGAVALAYRAAHIDTTILGGGWAPFTVGFVVLVAGLLFRAWAMLTLGRFFTGSVMTQEGQRVVDYGPYRFVRHPSYSGMLVALVGLGIALDDWLSLLVLALLPLTGILVRIRYEESVLLDALGEDYRDYASRTSRLVPGVW